MSGRDADAAVPYPLVVLAVAVGSVIAGIAGALLAVPLLAMLNAGIRALVGEDAKSHDAASGRVKTGDVSGGAEGNGVVVAAGSAFPPADVPADPDGGSRHGAGLNGAGLNRARSGPAHRRQ